MDRITKSFIAGGVISAIGIAYALNDRKSRKKVMRSGKKAMSRAASMMDDMW